MVVPVDIAKGNGVSVLHTDGHRYECKVMKNEGGKLSLHWHGFGKKYPEFQLEHDSDELGLLEDANVLPPPPTKSLKEKEKQGAAAYVSGNQTPAGTSHRAAMCAQEKSWMCTLNVTFVVQSST